MIRVNPILLVPTLALANFARGDLEIGTAFGANWLEVEDELRRDFILAVDKVHTDCAKEAVCSTDVARFCGYEEFAAQPRNFVNDVNAFEGVRHIFDPKCDLPRGPDCYLELCLEQCFPLRLRSTLLSDSCSRSVVKAEKQYSILRDQEEADDNRELFFKLAIPAIAFISMVLSILTVYLRRNPQQRSSHTEEVSNTTCEKFFITLDVFTLVILFVVIVCFCPLLVLVVVPPYLLVQVVYDLCLQPSPVEPIVETESGLDYHILQNEHEDCNVYEGIPVQI